MDITTKSVCFIHSCTRDIWGTEILDHIIDYIRSRGILEILEYVFINNIGIEIPSDLYATVSGKIKIMNYSSDTLLFENCTLRHLYFFSQFNPGYKILYMHTKGVSYQKSHPFVPGIRDWCNSMLYGLVDKHLECLEMLKYVDAIGSDYRCKQVDGNPDHFSGNFWWSNADYIKTLSVFSLNDKYDAEFWLFKNRPTFFNINKCPYGHCQNTYKPHQYSAIIDNRVSSMLQTLKDLNFGKRVDILYGIEGNYLNVTDICISKLTTDGFFYLPADDHTRNQLFTDPLHGVEKHVRIGDVKIPYTEDCRFYIPTCV
jgi:hypothetical protein